jgi:threonine aldolase
MFASDNTAPAHPKILEAMVAANAGIAPSYGADAWTLRAEAMLREIFERDCAVLFVPTGTAANALSLAALTPPWGAIISHRDAHIVWDEAGAPEFYTGGARVITIDGPSGKLLPATLDAEASRYSRKWVHGLQPFAVSISQATEFGGSYRPGEIAALSAVCRSHGLKLHMDGARFATAIAHTGASPAESSWKSGVDVLSFGATKNGALACEAILCFDESAAQALPHLRKRAGQLLSKHRYIAAQMVGYLEDGLWMTLAAQANAQAAALAEVFGARTIHAVEANEVFVRLAPAEAAALRAAGAAFHPSAPDGEGAYRFVPSWATTDEEVETVRRALSAA